MVYSNAGIELIGLLMLIVMHTLDWVLSSKVKKGKHAK
jgi:hypothetical protein